MKETLVAAGPVGVTGRGELRVFFLLVLDRGYERGSELLESSFFEKVKEEIKVQPIRTKKEENKKAKKEGPRKFLVQPRKDKGEFWVGHVYCKGKSELMTHL